MRRFLLAITIGIATDRVSPGPPARGKRPRLVALVRAGATFVNGKLVERPEGVTSTRAA
ncbi:hypothetical protein [Streptosporangium sp. NPDC002607]